jgi:transcriptional regulator with XRE-family HTH domain
MREKKEINIQIGEQARIEREQAKLTQEMLAEKIEVSPQYISDLERGVVGIALPTLKKLCYVQETEFREHFSSISKSGLGAFYHLQNFQVRV